MSQQRANGRRARRRRQIAFAVPHGRKPPRPPRSTDTAATRLPAVARMRLPIPVYRREDPIRPRPTLVSLLIATGLATAPTAPTLAVAAPRADNGAHRSLQRAVVRSVNSARARHQLPALRFQSRLGRAASAHSADQLRSGRPSHHSADGTPFDQRLRRYSRARRTGETIVWLAAGQPVRARTIVRMWLTSPSHRRVLLDRRFRRIGVGTRCGRARGHITTIVTADFATAR